MSFKRDGDDIAQLLNLQKRRVSDLLVTHIPEDEALLIRNGKYTCTVCSYRPVFDTLDMLAVHRKGKKHLHSLTIFLNQKKKDQEKFIGKNPGQPLPKNFAKKNNILGDHHGLLRAKPYNSCMKRKPAIDLSNKNIVEPYRVAESTQESTSVLSSYLKSLPEKKNFSDVVDERRTSLKKMEAVKHSETVTLNNVQAVIDFQQPQYSSRDIEMKKECLKLLESGWKKDWKSGKWVRDETVEFDSDEEPPEILEAT